jgi:uncharacterized protein (DUF2141 family)
MWFGTKQAARALRLAFGGWLSCGVVSGATASEGEALEVRGVPRSGSACGAQPGKAPERFPLTVRVSQLENDKGRVAVALFASADDFPDQTRALSGQLTRIQKGSASVTFPDLLPGRYAVAVLHDENENSKMDFNFLGMPLEGYGFSNGASAPFGPPSFDDAAFRLRARPSVVAVKVRYFL